MNKHRDCISGYYQQQSNTRIFKSICNELMTDRKGNCPRLASVHCREIFYPTASLALHTDII